MKSLTARACALAALTLCAALTACGGGGGGGSATTPTTPAAPTPTAEGFWTGTTSTGWLVDLAVLENGETWGLYYVGNVIYGALNGTTTWTASTISGSGSDFYFPTRTVSAGTYTGTYTSKASLRFTTNAGASGTAAYSTLYDTPASLSALAGTYSGSGLTATSPVTPQSITISASGAISGGITGCAVSGLAVPRGSGKGVFNLNVTLAGSLCAAGPNTSLTGIAVYDPSARKLTAMGLTSSKLDGFFFLGTK